MARKIALLIGVGEYGNGLKPLRCPANGVGAMQELLENPEIGGFDQVVPLINPDLFTMRSRISEVFTQNLTQHDMVLFYFTGHGIKDMMSGKFYLSTAQTQLFGNGSPNMGTAVSADFLKDVIESSPTRRKVIILDCCFAGAFVDGFLAMDDGSVDVETYLGGKGWCVLTAATSMKYALEQEGEDLSVYTRYLVEGLRTGGAAPDGQNFIAIGDLHQYVYTQVKAAAPAMEPLMFNKEQGPGIIIAKVQVDNAQRYRKEVQRKVNERNGRLNYAAKATLKQKQTQFKVSNTDAEKILDEVLKPYKERANHLETYTQALKAEKEEAYPFSREIIEDFEELKRLLNLRDEDVQAAEVGILGHRLEKSLNPLPEVPYKTLADTSKILYLKNIKDPNGWAYTLQRIKQSGGSVDSRVFELFWPASSKGAQTPSAHELIILHQRARVTHIVEVLDTDICSDNHGTYRWVRVLWMADEGDWSQLPHQREILGFEPPTIVGGATLSFQNKSFSSFWQVWNKLELFQNYVWLKLKNQINLSVQEYQTQNEPNLKFSFETIQVDENGKVIETLEKEAEFFAEDLDDGIKLEMVRIPGNTFMMGAAEGEKDASKDEYPQHQVTVPEFWMGKFAVTQEQWQAVAKLDKINRDLKGDPARFKGTKRPVEQISWEDAEEFCKRLSKKTKKEYKLPSEAQWEYACRAGTKTPFHFGPTITTDLANYRGSSTYGNGPKGQYRKETTKVGSFAIANSFGLYDMHGNVWEWCLDDWHDTYKDAPKDGSAWISSGKIKILRGGSWYFNPVGCRSANRYRLDLDLFYYDIGFRVVCFPPRT
ncbi:sulphatase-modifying factor protein [Leptolyngbya sp. Heron Island J]|uniref:caspase, EACC1-associated type n=1 Tax=Leptolyngbya sp. Heron Island J TaxID=1385935 RepID=UPI0003B96423|nr:SUMF1/EgtB/PvdO family nonheme iron enzyme [Leptolyngbya sp. Heron Island J]ESA36582.1 sulphatase-modifying factor protein [Leptolyngbya sp. Heron Island J]